MTEQGMNNHVREFGSPNEAKSPGWSDFLTRGIPEEGDSSDHVHRPTFRERDADPARSEARSRAYNDPAVVAAREAYNSARTEWFKTKDERLWRNNVMDLQAAEDEAFRAALKREMEEAGIWLKMPEVTDSAQFWHEEIVSAAAEGDPKVRALRESIAVAANGTPEEKWTYGRLTIALETAYADAYHRANAARVGAERREGTVLTPDARAWLSGLVELNGVEAVCAKFGVSAEIVRRLINGIPTPPTWRDVPASSTPSSKSPTP